MFEDICCMSYHLIFAILGEHISVGFRLGQGTYEETTMVWEPPRVGEMGACVSATYPTGGPVLHRIANVRYISDSDQKHSVCWPLVQKATKHRSLLLIHR